MDAIWIWSTNILLKFVGWLLQPRPASNSIDRASTNTSLASVDSHSLLKMRKIRFHHYAFNHGRSMNNVLRRLWFNKWIEFESTLIINQFSILIWLWSRIKQIFWLNTYSILHFPHSFLVCNHHQWGWEMIWHQNQLRALVYTKDKCLFSFKTLF